MDHQDIESRRERLGAAADHVPRTISHSYTRLVRVLRILLPLIVVAIVGILFFSSSPQKSALPIEKIEDRISETSGSGTPVIQKNELVKPEFESQTKDGKNYRIVAENAVQEVRQPDLILLQNPKGTLETNTLPLSVSALDGTYNQKTQFITLNQNVVIEQPETGRITMKTLEADLTRGEMFSPHPVDATGTYGTLHANSLRITDDGMKIIFEGPAKLVLEEGFDTWLD